MSAADWAVDIVLTEVARASPEPVPKEQLQQAAGTGASDMREALQQLVQEEKIHETPDGGYVLVQEDPQSVIGQLMSGQVTMDGDGDDEAEEDEDDEDPPEWLGSDAPGAAESAAPPEPGPGSLFPTPEAIEAARANESTPRVVATLALEISFFAEVKTGETYDQAARREAEEMLRGLRGVIEQQYPGVAIAPYVSGIEIYERSRSV